jgi:hypothetical protein
MGGDVLGERGQAHTGAELLHPVGIGDRPRHRLSGCVDPRDLRPINLRVASIDQHPVAEHRHVLRAAFPGGDRSLQQCQSAPLHFQLPVGVHRDLPRAPGCFLADQAGCRPAVAGHDLGEPVTVVGGDSAPLQLVREIRRVQPKWGSRQVGCCHRDQLRCQLPRLLGHAIPPIDPHPGHGGCGRHRRPVPVVLASSGRTMRRDRSMRND